MKLKPTVFLATFLVSLGLLLGTSTAQAEPIVTVDGDTATHIQNLDVNGTFYNVTFLFISADELYGETLVFDFPDDASAKAAKMAAVLALNTDNRATRVGPSAEQSLPDWGIGFAEDQEPSEGEIILFQNATYSKQLGARWVDADIDFRPPSTLYYYADFSPAGPAPDPVSIGGTVSDLLGSGLVLQNNDTDDLPISENSEFTFDTPLTPDNSYNVTVATNPSDPAQICIVENGSGTVPTEPVTDVAVTCVEAPDPVTIGGTVSGLVGSGLVLQNTGRDDLPISEDDYFTFDTPRLPGTFYDVTVAANPTNPAQTCSVANGSGEVPTTDVTNVAVTCAEPILDNLVKVAAEGDTLLDETVLKEIFLDGGVAINMDGQVAFGGQDGGGIDAVFTQAGKVVAEGETVGGTILGAFREQGEVAINAGLSGGTVAFHGIADTGATDTVAVFTQSRKVAAVGDKINEKSTLDDIDPEGKVAINYYNEVAFHGSVKIQGDVLDPPPIRAVFISEGLETRVVAREDSNLPDEIPLVNITESGGVAISDFGDVAFHGDTVDPAPVSDTLKAVFTQNGLIAKEGDILDDDTTLENINENGGVAINYVGEVAFHGSVITAGPFGDSVKAVFVFNQDGSVAKLVAKEGDILRGGTTLDEIEVNGGVAINLFREVAFHGRTGGVQAVFISDGQTIKVVAKVGDNVDDDTTLSEIHDTAGVAINPYGSEVAFHGKAGTTDTDAVFVGSAPDTGHNTPPVADFSFTTEDLTANFTDLSTDSDGYVVKWAWDFGDGWGVQWRIPNPTYTYYHIGAGTYDVTLTVTDSGGLESKVTKPVEVTEPPPPEVVLVFVTSEEYPGDFGGLAEADAICQAHATAAGRPGTWTAWLSDDDTDAIKRIPEPGPDGDYQLMNPNNLWGPIVADDLADLTDGSLDLPIDRDEYGEEVNAPWVWTGTQPDGTRTLTNCSNWTNAEGGCTEEEGDPACGTKGEGDKTSGEWTEAEPLRACDTSNLLYCFSTGQ